MDGASVNMGKNSGVVVKLQEKFHLSIPIHYAARRVQLCANDSFSKQ